MSCDIIVVGHSKQLAMPRFYLNDLPCHKFDSHVIAMTVFVQTDYNVGICVFLRNTHSYSWYVHCSYSLCR